MTKWDELSKGLRRTKRARVFPTAFVLLGGGGIFDQGEQSSCVSCASESMGIPFVRKRRRDW